MDIMFCPILGKVKVKEIPAGGAILVPRFPRGSLLAVCGTEEVLELLMKIMGVRMQATWQQHSTCLFYVEPLSKEEVRLALEKAGIAANFVNELPPIDF